MTNVHIPRENMLMKLSQVGSYYYYYYYYTSIKNNPETYYCIFTLRKSA